MMFSLLRHFACVLFCLVLLATQPVQANNRDKVALVVKSLTTPFFAAMYDSAGSYARSHDVELDIFGVERETDVAHQINIIDNLITLGYGAIILAPTDSVSLVPICKKAHEHGIPVIIVDTPLDADAMRDAGISLPFIGADNRAGGRMVGSYFKRILGNTGKVFVIGGYPGVTNGEERKRGFIEAVTAASDIDIAVNESANWRTDMAFSLVMRLLAEHPDVDGIFCANDFMALGALQALDLAGKKDTVILAGYDNIASVRAEISNGRIHATLEQHADLMGIYAVRAAIGALDGKKIADYETVPMDLVTVETFNKKIGFSVSNLANPFFAELAREAARYAALHGMSLTVSDAQDDPALQLRQIQEQIAIAYDLLLLNPTSTDLSAQETVTSANPRPPIITVDRELSGIDVLSHIASDNTAGGRMAAAYIATNLGGKGDLLELVGIPGTSAALGRSAGFHEEIAQHPGITVSHRVFADFDRATARKVMLDFFSAQKRADAIFAHNDEMLLGAIDAARHLGVKLPPVLVGYDALGETRRAIDAGIVSASIAQQPAEMGRLAIEAAVHYFRGEDVPPRTMTELTLITR